MASDTIASKASIHTTCPLNPIICTTLNKNSTKKKERLKFLMVFIITLGSVAALRHIFSFSIPAYATEETTDKDETEEEATKDSATTSIMLAQTDQPAALSDQPDQSDLSDLSDLSAPSDSSNLANKDSMTLALKDSLRRDSIRRRNTALFKKSGKIWDYDECLPDTQDQHISTAVKFGIKPVATHKAVMWKAKHHQLVAITESPFFVVEKLDYSLPYLVPRAKDLLTTISVNFLDSLQSKGYKPYLPIVTSVLRTTLDVRKLTRRNRNATENSCHSYGTTFDITYSRYMPLTGIPTPVDSAEWKRGELKLVLAEVLFDLRNQGKCFVKHEHRQPCFHITVR